MSDLKSQIREILERELWTRWEGYQKIKGKDKALTAIMKAVKEIVPKVPKQGLYTDILLHEKIRSEMLKRIGE